MILPVNVPVTSRLYLLKEDWQYSWRELRPDLHGILHMRTCTIRVIAGTLNDGASVPRILWSIVRPDGPIRGAALIHDVLFETRGKSHTTFEYLEDYAVTKRTFTLKETNNLFGLCLRASNVHWFHRIAARGGVAIGSKFIWERYPKLINDRIQEFADSSIEPLPILVQEHLAKGYVS